MTTRARRQNGRTRRKMRRISVRFRVTFPRNYDQFVTLDLLNQISRRFFWAPSRLSSPCTIKLDSWWRVLRAGNWWVAEYLNKLDKDGAIIQTFWTVNYRWVECSEVLKWAIDYFSSQSTAEFIVEWWKSSWKSSRANGKKSNRTRWSTKVAPPLWERRRRRWRFKWRPIAPEVGHWEQEEARPPVKRAAAICGHPLTPFTLSPPPRTIFTEIQIKWPP